MNFSHEYRIKFPLIYKTSENLNTINFLIEIDKNS